MGLCRLSIAKGCRVYRLDPLHEFDQVHVLHSIGPVQCPIDEAGFVDRVCKSGFDEIIAVNLFLPADKLRLLVDTVKRHDRERRIVLSGKNLRAVKSRRPHLHLVRHLWRKHAPLTVPPYKAGVAVQVVQNSPQRLVPGDLPKPYTCAQSAVLLVVQRRVFAQMEHLHVVVIHKAEGHPADQCLFPRLLQHCIEVFPELLCRCGVPPGHSVPKKVLVKLHRKLEQEVARHFKIGAVVVRHSLSAYCV